MRKFRTNLAFLVQQKSDQNLQQCRKQKCSISKYRKCSLVFGCSHWEYFHCFILVSYPLLIKLLKYKSLTWEMLQDIATRYNPDSVKGRSSHLDVFCKNGVLKNFVNIHRFSVCNFIKKQTTIQMFSCEFCKISKTQLFKYISEQLLLEEYWTSLKMVAIAIAMNASNACFQKEFVLISFLRSVYNKFVEIFIKTFINVFLVLEFSLPFEL